MSKVGSVSQTAGTTGFPCSFAVRGVAEEGKSTHTTSQKSRKKPALSANQSNTRTLPTLLRIVCRPLPLTHLCVYFQPKTGSVRATHEKEAAGCFACSAGVRLSSMRLLLLGVIACLLAPATPRLGGHVRVLDVPSRWQRAMGEDVTPRAVVVEDRRLWRPTRALYGKGRTEREG